MHRYRNGDASVIVHCQIEKERIPWIIEGMGEVKGVVEMEVLR
jgi:hypothetical protein